MRRVTNTVIVESAAPMFNPRRAIAAVRCALRNLARRVIQRPSAGFVQREACGLNDSAQAMQDYAVPNEVYARMGPLAMPSIHPKTKGG
jgi:hypothetical protein